MVKGFRREQGNRGKRGGGSPRQKVGFESGGTVSLSEDESRDAEVGTGVESFSFCSPTRLLSEGEIFLSSLSGLSEYGTYTLLCESPIQVVFNKIFRSMR